MTDEILTYFPIVQMFLTLFLMPLIIIVPMVLIKKFLIDERI